MPELHGCPSPDRDNDAIPNDVDRCPDDPETYNGFQDQDGCPDTLRGRSVPPVSVVERQGKKIVVLATPLRFQKGSVELEPRSLSVVRALAQQLLLTPTLRLTVAVRPSPTEGGEDLARSRTEALVTLLIRGSRRPGAAVVGGWIRGRMPPDAEVRGVALVISEEKAP